MLAAFHVHRVHPRDAVVAVVAAAACRGVALAELVYERRVVDQRPGHLHQFEPCVQRLVDPFAAHQPADIYQRAFQLGAEFLGVFQEIALLEGKLPDHEGPAPADEIAQPQGRVVAHRVDRDQPPHHGHRGLGHEPARKHDAVDTEAFDLAGYGDAFGNLDAAPEPVVHVVFHQYGRPRFRRGLHHFCEAHPHETHSVFQRPAVLVFPVVGVGREELRDQVAVPGMYLHRVEPRVVRGVDGLPEIPCHLRDLVLAHTPHGGVGIEVEPRRRADRDLPGGRQMGHVAAVPDLDAGRRAFAVYGVGYPAQPGHDLWAQPQLLVERQPAAAYRGVGQRGHPHAAARHRNVVLLELLRGAEMTPHRLERRRTYRAVAQCHGA